MPARLSNEEKRKQNANKKKKKKKSNDKDQDSDTDHNESSVFPRRQKSERAKMGQCKAVGSFTARENFALAIASMRGRHYKVKQDSISSLPKYRLDKDCDASAFKVFQESRYHDFWKVRSLEVARGSVATPPESEKLYHMVEIMDNKVSVLQLLFELYNGYYVGFRPTPPDPNAKGGFYTFSKVVLPDYFGACHEIGRAADYQASQDVMVGGDSIGIMTTELSAVTPKSVKGLSGGITETPMIVFGEGIRFREFQNFIALNINGGMVPLTAWLCVLYGNWSCLSKLSFHLRLAIWEMVLRCHGRHATMRREWQLLRRVLTKFEDVGHPLVLFNEAGYLCYGRLVGPEGILRVLKFEESIIKKLIIRSQGVLSSFKEVNDCTREDSESDTDRENDADDGSGEESDEEADEEAVKKLKKKYQKMADAEYENWEAIIADGEDLLEELLAR